MVGGILVGVLDKLIQDSLLHVITSVYRMTKGISGQVPANPHATNVPCAWTSQSEAVLDASNREVITGASVRVLPSLDVNSDDYVIKDGKHYRVLKIVTPQPDFDGTIPYKTLKVV